jgi:cytidyltransferase-like protein
MVQPPKIRTIEELPGLLADLRRQGKRIVHSHGVYDLLHAGVVRQLQQAKKQGDLLVVTLTPDDPAGKGQARSMVKQELRAEVLASLVCVDLVAVGKGADATEAIQAIRPEVYVPWEEDAESSAEAAKARQAELALVETLGGKIVWPAKLDVGARGLVYHHSPAVAPEADQFLASFCAKYSIDDVMACLQKVARLKVLFVGETIIDEYQHCETIGKSGKEPILAARYLSSEKFAGGVISTANQAATVCDHVGVLTLLGTVESHEQFIRDRLNPHITPSFLSMPGARTILKRRLVEHYPLQKLFEVYFMETEVAEPVTQALCARLQEILPDYDAVVVTDYGHGMLTPEAIEILCRHDRFLAINTQVNAANQGFNTVSKYRRADFICVSEKELRLEARNRSKDIRLIMAETAQRMDCKRVLITRGREGCLCYHRDQGVCVIPPFTNRIVDRIGAGDALLAVTSLCASQDAPMEIMGLIGNAVGAQAVQTVGNRQVVSRESLLEQIHSLLNYDHWISTP